MFSVRTHVALSNLNRSSTLKPIGFVTVHVFEKNAKELRGDLHVDSKSLQDEEEDILYRERERERVHVCRCERECVCVSDCMCVSVRGWE